MFIPFPSTLQNLQGSYVSLNVPSLCVFLWLFNLCKYFFLRFHILAGESRGEVLGNSFNGGQCTTVKHNDTRKSYRVPANLEAVSFQVLWSSNSSWKTLAVITIKLCAQVLGSNVCFRTRFPNLVRPERVTCGNGIYSSFEWLYSHCSNLCSVAAYQSQYDGLVLLSSFLMAVAISLFLLSTKGLALKPDILWPGVCSSPKLISASVLYLHSTNSCPNSSFLLVICSLGT